MLQFMQQLRDKTTTFLQPYWNIFKPHWGKFINLALIIAAYLLWEQTKNTTQDVGDLKLQVQTLNDTCCVNTSRVYPVGNVTENTVSALTTNVTSSVIATVAKYSMKIAAIIPIFIDYAKNYTTNYFSSTNLPYQKPLDIFNDTNTTSANATVNVSTGTALCTPGSCNAPLDDPETRKLSNAILNYYDTKSVKSRDMVTEEHTPISDNEKCELVCRKLYQAP